MKSMHTLECNEFIHVYGIDPKASLYDESTDHVNTSQRSHLCTNFMHCATGIYRTYMTNIIYCTQAPHKDINILQQFTQPWGYR